MAELIEPLGRGPEETVILPPLVLASPTSYSYTKSLGRERLDSLRTTRSLRSTGIQGKEETRPRTVKQLLLERIGSAGSTLSFPRPGTRGEFLDPSKLPTPLERIWDRADEVAEATMLVHTEAELQMAEYSKIHDTLLREEERYDNLTVEHCKMTEEVSDTLLRMAEAKQRVHRKELFLTHLRRQNIDKLEADADALCSLRANDGWMASKHSKFAMQREAARLERQLLSWRHTADTEFQAARVQLDKALQEEQRLETALRALEAAMSETKAKVVDEEEALRALQGEPDAESGPFGWFVDPEDLSITSGLSGLRVNIQRLDSLGSSSKVHALSCLEGRYTHLRSLAAELRRVNASAQMFRHDISLNSVIFAVQQQTAEALEASSVRLLLVDDTHQRLWCLEGAAGEEEQVYIPLGPGVTGACAEEHEPVAVVSCSEDGRFDQGVDSPAVNLVVNNMLVLPVAHPYQPTKLLGVIQAHNHKGGTEPFTRRDIMVGQLLAEQAAIALKSGLEFHSWSTREAMMSRVRATASALLQELNLRQLISATQRACKDLLKATHAAIYLVEREDGGGLIFKEGFDSSAEPLSPKRSPCFEILKQVAADGLVAIIPDASKDERFDSAAEEAEGGGMRTRALMAQALRNTAGRVIGVMEVSRAEDVRRKGRRGGADAMPADAFSWEDTEALGMLCSVTSVALENARLAALCQRTPGTVLHEINRVCVSGMQKAMPSVLSRLNQAKIFVPCKLVRIFLKVEDAHEVWVYDSSQENPGAHPARVALAEGPGPVRAAFKSKRTSIQQIGGAPPTSATPNKNGSQDGVVKGHRKVAAMGGVKTRANLSVAPLPAAFVAPDKASGTLVFPPCVQGDEVKYVITAPAYTHDGGPVVAVVQVVNKLDGLPFTQQDEFLIRGAATEVAVMLEAARAASDASTASQHLSVLTAFADTLGSLEGGREDPKFEAFLEEEFRKSVACDSFATFWHVPEQGVLLGPDGHTVHQGDLDTLPPPNTPATPEAMTATDDRHVLSSFVEKKTLVVAGPLSVLCVPVISQTEPTSPCLGIITVTGGPKRAKATGGTTFTRAEKRLLEDLAAHVAVWLDIQAVDTGLSSHRSNVSILKALAQIFGSPETPLARPRNLDGSFQFDGSPPLSIASTDQTPGSDDAGGGSFEMGYSNRRRPPIGSPEEGESSSAGPIRLDDIYASRAGDAPAAESHELHQEGRYAGQRLLPTHSLPSPPLGPCVWTIHDEDDLAAAVGQLLQDPLERRSRGRAASQAAATLAANLVSTVWDILDLRVIKPSQRAGEFP